MAAFVGFIVQSNGVHWPFPLTPGFEYTAVTPPEQWDAMPFEGKCQIIAFVGFLEWWSEFGGPHYMKGGRPGDFPDFKDIPLHKIPSLYDPAGLSKNGKRLLYLLMTYVLRLCALWLCFPWQMAPEKKEKRLLMGSCAEGCP